MRKGGLSVLTRRWLCAALAVCCALALSGCAPRAKEEQAPLSTLAPAAVTWAAPDGDFGQGLPKEYLIYSLDEEGNQWLRPRQVTLTAADLYDTARQLVDLALSRQENGGLGGGVPLTLYGDSPVEISGGICTVNLGSSALQLSHSAFYRACVALATTLCELDEISFVNVLVADQSVGLDITGNLAMGSLTAHPDENLAVLWEQMEAKRTPLGADLSRTPLTGTLATLYTPLPDGGGITCENRILSFEGQTPHQLANGLIDAMDEIASARFGAVAEEFWSLRDLMLHDPLTSELEDGGRLITLSFREDAPEKTAEQGMEWSCLLAAVTCTLETFIPGIAAVCVRLGDNPVTEVSGTRFPSRATLGGLLKRNAFGDYLMSETTVFFARGSRLCRCGHPVEKTSADQPRSQLSVLLAGPTASEQAQGISATLPSGIRDDDILGLAREGDTLLLNLGEGFRSEIQAWGPERETLLCYSIVNTLCEMTDTRRVVFFFEGEQVERIAGTVYWAGSFLYNPGLCE